MEDHASEIVSVFKRFDFDKDGTIRRDELARVLRSLEPAAFNEAAVDTLLSAADTNLDGAIDYEEFAVWVTNDSGVQIMSQSKKLDHAFLTHAKRFEWHAVFDLLDRRPDLINCHISGRWSALHQAARFGDPEVVGILLERRANCSLTTRDGQTPIQIARSDEIKEMLTQAMTRAEHTSADSVQDLLKHSEALLSKVLPGLEGSAQELAEEVRRLTPEERADSAGFVWRVRGRRRDTWYDFNERDIPAVEDAYQAWLASGSSKAHKDRRVELEIHISSSNDRTVSVSIDFVLMTQRANKRAIRSIKRFVLPSKARQICDPYFDDFISLIGDVCEKMQQVEFSKAALGLSAEQSQDITRKKNACIEALKTSVAGFLELSVLCNADDLSSRLTALLGEEYAARLKVASYVKEMHLRTVCKEVEEALKARGHAGMQPPWDRVRELVKMGIFGERPMVSMRQSLVQTERDKDVVSRRHAFMVAGSFLREAEEDEELLEMCRAQLQRIIHKALSEAMRGGGSMVVIKELLSNSSALKIADFSGEVMDWLQQRFQSALRSNQPAQWAAELLAQARDLPHIDVHLLAEPLVDDIAQKCADGIIKGSLPPSHVNQMKIFRGVLDTAFDEALFVVLQSMYEENSGAICEWLVAYCEHTEAELPGWIMTADQKEAFNNLQSAVETRDVGQLKAAVIAAKTVPDLKDNSELKSEFQKALDILRAESHLPPGWDLEDLLGTEKMFKKEPITDDHSLALFQELMISTHQKRWTRDRAKRGDGEAIADSFQVSRVTEVQNGSSWENYDRRRREIVAACNPRGGPQYAPLSEAQWKDWSGLIMTEDIGHKIATACKLSPLEPKCNEFLMFHGANPKVADLIAENHFDISFASKDGLFGAGLYFAEASSKSDEYVSANDDDEFPLLLVRVMLGRPKYVDQQKPWEDPGRRTLEHECMSGTYHSVIGDRIKTSGTYREMVVYDHFQAYPHFIIWYRRV